MIIRKAKLSDKETIYRHWKEIFAADDFGTIDYFFKNISRIENFYVAEIDKEIVGGLYVGEQDMRYQEVWLKVALISGVYTVEKFRHRQVMTKLLTEVMDQLKYRYLFTMLRAYEPELYQRFGFEPVFQQQKSRLKRSSIAPLDSSGIRFTIDYAGALASYHYYGAYFNGYFRKSVKDLIDLHQLVRLQDGDMFTLVRNDVVAGYLAYVRNNNETIVQEIIYQDGDALLKLLNYLLSTHSVVTIYMPESLPLNLFIDRIESQKEISHLVCLNDAALFNRLFNVKVTKADSALKAFGKPLFNNYVD